MQSKGRRALLICAVALGAFAALSTATERSAEACGGFFCDSAQPISQQAERIIFAQNDDNTVTAVVQIMYTGPAEKFAWLLPVSGDPQVGVSSDTAFQRLQQATGPTYRMNTTVEGRCRTSRNNASIAENTADAGAFGDASNSNNGGVNVVSQGAVGPYDYTTISVEAGATDPAQTAVDWLTENGYDVTTIGADLIRPYLENGMNLIAFKLTKSTDSGDIRPVTLTYPAELPMIPIKLTAVAANDDMGVLVWVLGESRAVPSNYRSLELNDALINWFNPNSNYNDVVTQAADEANGQGFVPEYADASANLDEVVFSSADRTRWNELNDASRWNTKHSELILRTLASFRSFDGFNLVVNETVPLPAETTTADFLSCPACAFPMSESTIEGFSPSAFLSSVEEHVIRPMQDTEALITSRPYITRLYTTMSASEMTIDPVFDFNSSLPNYSNVHVAERTIFCSSAVFRNEAPWKAVLPSGEEVHGEGNTWPFNVSDDMPATRLVRQEHSSGSGDTISDNTPSIAATISDHNDTVSLDPGGDSGGCQVVGLDGPVKGGLLVLFFIGLGVVRRRSRP